MIHHISIAAHNPLRVSSVLAEILNGRAYKFLIPGSYTVMPFDKYGTAIAVFAQGDVWVPGANAEPAQVIQTAPTNLVAVHAAISVPSTQQQIEQIGQREEWRILTRKQGDAPFNVIEFWLENRLLMEFLPPEFETQYLQAMQTEIIEKVLGQPIQFVPI